MTAAVHPAADASPLLSDPTWKRAYDEHTAMLRAKAAGGGPLAVFALTEHYTYTPYYEWIGRGAAQHARWCGSCGRDLDPTEQVWRQRLDTHEAGEVGPRSGYVIGPVCLECSHYNGHRHRDRRGRLWDIYVELGPCGGCGRPVGRRYRNHYPRRTPLVVACCADCYRSARQVLRRQGEHDRRCAECATEYRSLRADSRYCSNACRQSAHRRRAAPTAEVTR